MVGGTIIESRTEGVKTRIWCLDPATSDECAIYVWTRIDGMPEVGDQIWWQGRNAYWTPKDRRFTDRAIERTGHSFDPRGHA